MFEQSLARDLRVGRGEPGTQDQHAGGVHYGIEGGLVESLVVQCVLETIGDIIDGNFVVQGDVVANRDLFDLSAGSQEGIFPGGKGLSGGAVPVEQDEWVGHGSPRACGRKL